MSMNILFLARLYYPHVGGVEKHVEKISEILSKNHEITLVCEKHDPLLSDIEIYKKVKIYRIPHQDKWSIWKWWLNHLNLFRDADIIHIHDVFFWFLPFKLLFFNKKIFMTFHGYEGSDAPSIKQIIWHKIAEKLSNGNICIGDFHRKWYKVKPTIVSYGAA